MKQAGLLWRLHARNLTTVTKPLFFLLMFLSNLDTGKTPAILISKDEVGRLRERVWDIPNCLRGNEEPTWMFVGKCAMPNSEHLIPSLT